MNRLRWVIILLGPLPILGSSWAVSAWFRSEPTADVRRNDVAPALAVGQSPAASRKAHPSLDGEPPPGALNGMCRQSAQRLQSELGTGCRVIVRSPFVIGGDLGEDQLSLWHSSLIDPAARAMARTYFDSRPAEPITILLFENATSYDRHAQQLFGESGISIYGYYKPNARTLILNVATGEGTLVHELTHALVDFDFPAAPDWLNEGLASLHEQCRFRTDRDGLSIEGLVNWRLAPLQSVIRQQRLRPLSELVREPDFRGRLEGTNYAQARYFCLYLQHEGLLETFFRAFRANHRTDPQGTQTLAEVLGAERWRNIDRDFQSWTLSLPPAP